MCILLKLHYAKFDVSSLFCSKVIQEKSLGVRLPPLPPWLRGVKQTETAAEGDGQQVNVHSIDVKGRLNSPCLEPL